MCFFLQKARGFPAFSDGVTDSKYTISQLKSEGKLLCSLMSRSRMCIHTDDGIHFHFRFDY